MDFQSIVVQSWSGNQCACDVSGAGNLGDGMPVTVSGTHDHPDVTLEFTDGQNAFAGRFTGSLSDDERVLEGVYNFNLFFVNHPLTLTQASVTLFPQ